MQTEPKDYPFTPREIVAELDKYIIGQHKAKRCVAIALRNRWRRNQVLPPLRDEIAPKNIIMIGPTGVGKTEIARRLAKLAQAPFIKVEATKFTEVGYVGRDVDSMVRDLVEIAINQNKSEESKKVENKAKEIAQERLLDLLLPPTVTKKSETLDLEDPEKNQTRDKLRNLLLDGKLSDRYVELEVADKNTPMIEIFSNAGMEGMDINVKDMFGNMFPQKKKKRRVKVSEALQILILEESQKLIDLDKVIKDALEKVEQSGIIFFDEIDKIAGRGNTYGPDISREGVQRDILPIVEGSTVATKYGLIKTDHILFIAAGAFHTSKPSDLIPELQGRFPIRVELDSLTQEDFIRILKEPDNSLVKQYTALLETEGIRMIYTDDGLIEISKIAAMINQRTENIGARRLYTVMEKLLDEISFNATDMVEKELSITAQYVRDKLKDVIEDEDLSRYIL